MNLPAVKDSSWWLEWQLTNWARYMRGDELPQGAPSRACGGLQNYSNMFGDFDVACEHMDCQLAEATNAAIEGLPSQAEQVALYVEYGVASTVFRFTREPFDQVVLRAKHNVRKSLERRGIWLG